MRRDLVGITRNFRLRISEIAHKSERFGEESVQKTPRKAFAGVTEKLLWPTTIVEVGRNNIDYEMQNEVA